MPLTILENIKGSELPCSWLEKTNETPDRTFRITIEAQETKIAKDLQNGKWTRLIEKIERERPLEGASEELLEASKQFRNDCSFNEIKLSEND